MYEKGKYLFYLYATAKSEICICSIKHETGLVVTDTLYWGSLAIIPFREQLTKALASLRVRRLACAFVVCIINKVRIFFVEAHITLILLNLLVIVKAAPHERINRTGQL